MIKRASDAWSSATAKAPPSESKQLAQFMTRLNEYSASLKGGQAHPQ